MRITHETLMKVARKAVAKIEEASAPESCTWGDNHVKAHTELFQYREEIADTIAEVFIEELERIGLDLEQPICSNINVEDSYFDPND